LYARLALSLWYCMHNYYYDIVCMQNYVIIPLVRSCDVLYIELCIDHANIFINSSPENHKYMLSVRKVVPTLTSNERWDLPLNGRC
jgi:hypothetical protein